MTRRSNTWFVVAPALLALANCAGPPSPTNHPPSAKPMRVMSISQCTDQLVLALLPPERIVSVTWLSRNPDGSLMHREATRVGVNHGLSEEVVRQRPDLVIAGTFTTPTTRALLKRLNFPMIEVGNAENYEDIRRITRQVARAVGEEARGEALIAQMDTKLSALAQNPGPHPRLAAWDGAGFSANAGTLYDTLLRSSGAVNAADEMRRGPYGRADVETLLLLAPSLLVKGVKTRHDPGLRENVERHPIIRQIWDSGRTLTVRQAYYICGTPMAADAALELRNDLRAATTQASGPLPYTRPRANIEQSQ